MYPFANLDDVWCCMHDVCRKKHSQEFSNPCLSIFPGKNLFECVPRFGPSLTAPWPLRTSPPPSRWPFVFAAKIGSAVCLRAQQEQKKTAVCSHSTQKLALPLSGFSHSPEVSGEENITPSVRRCILSLLFPAKKASRLIVSLSSPFAKSCRTVRLVSLGPRGIAIPSPLPFTNNTFEGLTFAMWLPSFSSWILSKQDPFTSPENRRSVYHSRRV